MGSMREKMEEKATKVSATSSGKTPRKKEFVKKIPPSAYTELNSQFKPMIEENEKAHKKAWKLVENDWVK